ncbi:MAG: hypothetical protein ABR503_10100, partial [Chitinophagaceae bacterium]
MKKLVKFKVGISEEAKNKAFARIGGKITERILTNAMKHFGDNDGIYLLHTPLQAFEAISRISGVEIEYAEPNWIYTHPSPTDHLSPTDPYYTGDEGQLWGMGSTAQY